MIILIIIIMMMEKNENSFVNKNEGNDSSSSW